MTLGAIDVHQHLWPEELLDRLRARSRAPYLRGWTLHLDGEPPYDVDPRAHDVAARVAADAEAGVGLACVSLSAPLGLETLPPPSARPLLDAWHRGVRSLPQHYRAWASVPRDDADPSRLADLLGEDRFVGVQLPATDLLTPRGWEGALDLLRVAEAAGRAVLVHPGPEPAQPLARDLPGWWAPVVGYSAQLQAAWWAWHAAGLRHDVPRLPVVFVAAAGLAPLLTERHQRRGGTRTPVDPLLLLDTSGHGERALEAVVRVVGIDPLVLGSDAPYAAPLTHLLGQAATHAVLHANPHRLLGTSPEGAPSWTPAPTPALTPAPTPALVG